MRHSARRGALRRLIALFIVSGLAILVTACAQLADHFQGPNEPLPSLIPTAIVPMPQPTPTKAVAGQVVARTPTAEPVAPAPTAESAATLAPTPTFTPYEVQADDTYWSIAAAAGLTVPELLAANDRDENQLIYPGDVLFLPPAMPTFDVSLETYVVAPGDTLDSIAADRGVANVELLRRVNGLGAIALAPGMVLRIPVGAYEVQPGDTLSQIAEWFDINLDALARANATQLDLDDLDYVRAGAILVIPPGNGDVVADCSPAAPSEKVLTYVLQPGEGYGCLSLKFELPIATIRNANPDRGGDADLVPGITLLIPPAEGALYVVTGPDVEREISTDAIAAWYGVPAENVLDWDGEVVRALAAGTRLFVREADPLAGTFDSAIVVGFALAVAPAPAPAPAQPGDAVVTPPPSLGSAPASGDPPAGANLPAASFWSVKRSDFDTGYCDLVDGFGWSGSLSWPVSGRTIQEDRGFRPGHGALDIDADEGTPVYAADSGVVIWAGFSTRGGGNMVALAHGGSWQTYYMHLSEVSVSCGMTVSRGAQIGLSGQTGAASWPHLHFEVQVGGFEYDPLKWLP